MPFKPMSTLIASEEKYYESKKRLGSMILSFIVIDAVAKVGH